MFPRLAFSLSTRALTCLGPTGGSRKVRLGAECLGWDLPQQLLKIRIVAKIAAITIAALR